MKCSAASIAMSAYLDDELSAEQSRQIDEHIQSCAQCTAEYRELKQLGIAIQDSDLYQSAPHHLRQRVSAGLKQMEQGDAAWFGVPAKLAFGIPVLLIGVVIGWASVSTYHSQQAQDDLITALASAHIRSLMVDHLTDIASSDSHTVKPWFHGRLDFSPPVYDLTGDGYPLIGGRLEYIAGDAAAALVYRHRQHTINLFISPKTAKTSDVKSTGYKGYNVINWNDASLSYWLISDLNLSDLEQFRALYNSRVTSGAARASRDGAI